LDVTKPEEDHQIRVSVKVRKPELTFERPKKNPAIGDEE
jgi:hypothetical protein